MPKVFKYHPPPIPSAGVYYFTSGAGVDYEVRFGRKQGNILSSNIVFGVLNDEYDGEEYALTHKGEFYSVMATLEAIISDFRSKNPNVHTFEFSGEPRDEEEKLNTPTKRTLLYLKYAKQIFPPLEWRHTLAGNKVSIERL
ncbi:MAG: hypothetical protein RLP15_13310 [Cryomorphaceae bacterium]